MSEQESEFEKWWERVKYIIAPRTDGVFEPKHKTYSYSAWNHQQKRIDELELALQKIANPVFIAEPAKDGRGGMQISQIPQDNEKIAREALEQFKETKVK